MIRAIADALKGAAEFVREVRKLVELVQDVAGPGEIERIEIERSRAAGAAGWATSKRAGHEGKKENTHSNDDGSGDAQGSPGISRDPS